MDSGRKACRTGANDRRVIGTAEIEWHHQPDAMGKFRLAGIALQLPAPGTHDRQLIRTDVKALNERGTRYPETLEDAKIHSRDAR